jgi:hypothetical protein
MVQKLFLLSLSLRNAFFIIVQTEKLRKCRNGGGVKGKQDRKKKEVHAGKKFLQ